MLKKIITMTAIILGIFGNVGMAANISDEPAEIFVQKYNAFAREYKLDVLDENLELLLEDDGYKFYNTYTTPVLFTTIIFVTRDDSNFERLIITSIDAGKNSVALVAALRALGVSDEDLEKVDDSEKSRWKIFCTAANRDFILEFGRNDGAYEVEISAE